MTECNPHTTQSPHKSNMRTPKGTPVRWAPIGQMRHRIQIRTVCGEVLTKLLRSTYVCLVSICDSFHKS
jgi:hypothetical protein